MSNQAQTCPHCGFAITGDARADDELGRRKRDRTRRQLQMHSMISMVLFTLGAILFYHGTQVPDSWQGPTGKTILAVGIVLYLVTRIRILIFNRSAK
jgi:hypothetical protein